MTSFAPDPVEPSETLSRYIFHKDHYRTSDHSVRHTAFMPRSDDLRISVTRTSGLSDSDVWDFGGSVGQSSDRTLHGRGDIIAERVFQQNLVIDPDNNPPRHANIVGWPQDKGERKLVAQILASHATLRLINGQQSAKS